MVSNVHLSYQFDSTSKDCSGLSSTLSNTTVLDIMNLAALEGRQYCSHVQPVLYIVDYMRNIGMRLIHAVVAGVEYWPPKPYNVSTEGWELSINGTHVSTALDSTFVSNHDSLVFKFGKK